MGDPNGSPDARDSALRSALERLVLLECRAQLQPGPTADSAELELARWRLAARRAEERAVSAEAQRDRLFARLIAAERTQAGLAGEASDVDLASFIAELRAELARLEQARDVAERQRTELLAQLRDRERSPTPPDSAQAWAERLSDQGLFSNPGVPLAALERDLVVGSAAERALLQGVLRDLSDEDEPVREAAAERLSSLPAPLAAPIFAAALSRERSPAVLARIIRGAGLTRVPSLGPLLVEWRTHEDPRVRAAILFAEARLSQTLPSEHWFKDADPRVRRRAALAAALHAPAGAVAALSVLAADVNPGVREAVAAGAAALSLPPSTLLLRLAQDPELRVRRAALRALAVPPSLADLPAAERRKALREFLKSPPPAGDGHRDKPLPDSPGSVVGPTKTAAARVDLDAVERELRGSLRGRSPEQLAELAGVDAETLNRALEANADRFVLRGPKWFAT